jgi:peptidoglycan/LPS O-acetylase OafA/YrhL
MTIGSSLFLIDAIKAVASQLIVWHHLAAYSPMSDVLQPHAPNLANWLYTDARLAVQAFLVIGGFLAARSLAPRPDAASDLLFGSGLLLRLWSRYRRLALPYVIALAVAVACAALARSLADNSNTPAAPTLPQIFAHVTLLQDITHIDALSAGVWYVAIDFQLYALFILLLWGTQRLARLAGLNAQRLLVLVCGGFALASLLWLNRNSDLDLWAVYFFGSYGLGIFAQWASTATRKTWWVVTMAGVLVAALAIDWRSRILVAGLIALLLATGSGTRISLRGIAGTVVAALGRISYPVFLIHYPVSLLVGALMLRWGSSHVGLNAAALLAAWLLSLAAGAALHRSTENGWRWRAGLTAVRARWQREVASGTV